MGKPVKMVMNSILLHQDTSPNLSRWVEQYSTSSRMPSSPALELHHYLVYTSMVAKYIKKWHPTENPQYAKNNQARSKGLAKPWSAGCLSSVQLISAVIISTAFIAVLLFFSTVMTDIKERVSNFVGANMVFGLLLPGMGWTLEVFAELLGKVKGSCS